MSNDLKDVFPGREVAIRGETVCANPFYARQLPKVFALARDIQPALQASNGDMMAALALAGDANP
jgi:hypothetical protein